MLGTLSKSEPADDIKNNNHLLIQVDKTLRVDQFSEKYKYQIICE